MGSAKSADGPGLTIAAGWYQEGRARMYVHRGVGFSQTWPFRLFCPLEIACFTLRAERP